MTDRIECFWIQPTDYIRRSLRRFEFSDGKSSRCPLPHGYHNAEVPLDTIHVPDSAREPIIISPNGWSHDDPRWPKACACGHVFDFNDQWQLNQNRVYERPDTIERMLLDEAPPGAMFDADWYKPEQVGPDGMSLVVILPCRTHWFIDAKGQPNATWTRTGSPPKITAHPSILTRRYHGWLRDGYLVEA